MKCKCNCRRIKGLTMSGDQRTVIKGNPSQYVKLNVGGCLYYTTIGTLTKAPDTMLQAMFSGRMEVLTDPEGLCNKKYNGPFRVCGVESLKIIINLLFAFFRVDTN